MIEVTVKINERVVCQMSAVNVSTEFNRKYGEGEQIYRLKNKKLVLHNFEEGSRDLAIKLLKVSEEKK